MNQNINPSENIKHPHYKFVYQCPFFYKKEFTQEVNKSINNYFLEMKQFLNCNMKTLSPQLQKFNISNPTQQELVQFLKERQFLSLDKITQLSPASVQLTKEKLQQTINELIICVIYSIKAPIGFLLTSKNVYRSLQSNNFHVNYLNAAGYAFILHQTSISIEQLYQIYPYLDSQFIPFEKFILEQKTVSASQQSQQKIKYQEQKKKQQQYKKKLNFYLKSKVKSLAVILLQIIIKKNISKQLLDNEKSLGSHHYLSIDNKNLLKTLIENMKQKYQILLEQNKELINSTQKDTDISLYNFFWKVLVEQNEIQWRQLVTLNAFSFQKNIDRTSYLDLSHKLHYGYVFALLSSELKINVSPVPQKKQKQEKQQFIKRVKIEISNTEIRKQFKRKQLIKRDKIMQHLCIFMHIYIFQNLNEQERQEYFRYKLDDFTMFIPFFCKLQMEHVLYYRNWPTIFIQYNKKSLLLKEYIYDIFQFLVHTCEKYFSQGKGYAQVYQDKQSQNLLENAKYLIDFKHNNFYMNLTSLVSICLRNNAQLK